LGCEGMFTAVAGQEVNSSSSQHHSTIVADSNACSSNEGHGCCKTKVREPRSTRAVHSPSRPGDRTTDAFVAHKSSESRLAESSTGGMKTCPFAISRALAVSKIHDGQMNATTAVSQAMSRALVREQTLPLSTLSPMPNRGHTYLRCCAFLI